MLNLIITLISYMLIPVLLLFSKEPFSSKKEALNYAIINSIIIYIAYTLFYYIIGPFRFPNIAPAIFYAFINYYLFCKFKSK